jgi:hypothetical protein
MGWHVRFVSTPDIAPAIQNDGRGRQLTATSTLMEKLFADLSLAALNAPVRYVACCYCHFLGGKNPPVRRIERM